MRIYLDTCVVIYWLEGEPALADAVSARMGEAAGAEFCISDLVRLECRVGPLRSGDTGLLKAMESLLSRLTNLPLETAVFDIAADLRVRHNLKTPDAIHAAAAIHHRCSELWTNDHRLQALATSLIVRKIV